MRIVNVFGGLGNQMFQYALTRALEERFHEPVFVDTHYYNDYSRHNGLEIERLFPIKLHVAQKSDIQKLAFYSPNYKIHRILKRLRIKKRSTILEVLSKPFHQDVFREGSTYYDGYWQDSRYFTNIESTLLDCFKFKLPLDAKNQALADKLRTSDSVGIHVRRGDYLKKARYLGICDVEYYAEAIRKVAAYYSNPHFYIFSNDIAWCQDNLIGLLPKEGYTIVDWNRGNNSYVDMQLMTCCKSLIIANSSFSWWAAYLNRNNDMIIAPKTWFNTTTPLQIQLKNWTLI